MSTKAQKDANRENAKKSTGPKTPEGKAKSSKNATKHGLFTCQDVIKSESQVEYDMFRGEMLEEFDPIGPMQYRLADRIVSLSWRLKRAETMHNLTIEAMLERENSDHELALGRMANKDFSYDKSLDHLMMYERRMENSLYKTIKELKKLQKEKAQNDPNFNHYARESRLMKNEPNLHDQMNITQAISKDYDLARPGELPQKTINKLRPKSQTRYGGADSKNNQLKDVIAKRNQGRSEASHYPRRPLRARINKK